MGKNNYKPIGTGKTMGEIHRKTRENQWETFLGTHGTNGKSMRNPWENGEIHGKLSVRKMDKNHGMHKNHGRIMGESWENQGKNKKLQLNYHVALPSGKP